jgi:hypothetical protein
MYAGREYSVDVIPSDIAMLYDQGAFHAFKLPKGDGHIQRRWVSFSRRPAKTLLSPPAAEADTSRIVSEGSKSSSGIGSAV